MVNMWVKRGQATKSDDMVVFVKNPSYRKPTVALKRLQDGRRIHRTIEKLGTATITHICKSSGYSIQRVLEHVNYHVDKGHLKLESPTHRARVDSERNMAKQRVRPGDGQPSNKHGVFAYFLAEPEDFDAELAHKKYPSVDLATIVSWESVWRNWSKNTFTGSDGFPRGMADTAEQIALIKSAIQRARNARGTGRRTALNRNKVSPEDNFAGEFSPKQEFVEGAVSQVLVNRFERDPKARAACLQEFGYSCAICDMNFVDSYGKIGHQFIHVHHRRPLALRRENYQPDPSKDLVPVCPNCHAMLHTSDPPLEAEELRAIWKKQHSL